MFDYFKKQLISFKYAFTGLKLMLEDYNIFIHVPAAFCIICLGFFFNISSLEWISTCSAITLVWVTEILNTALEKLVDLVSPNRNKLAGQVKDLAAGAVLITTFYAILVGIIIFGKRIIILL